MHGIIEWYPTNKDLQGSMNNNNWYGNFTCLQNFISPLILNLGPTNKFHIFISNSLPYPSSIWPLLWSSLPFHNRSFWILLKTLPPITFHHGSLCSCYFILNDIFKQCLLATFTRLLAKFKVQVYELLQRFYKPLGPSTPKTTTKCINYLAW